LLAAALALLSGSAARATCVSTACPDPTAMDNVRALVASGCDCAGAAKHAGYVRCAKQVIRGAIRGGALARSCKHGVTQCEAKSTCGRKRAVVCCSATKRGVKAKMVTSAGKCRGTPCPNPVSVVDACTADATCAAPLRGIQSFRSVQRVFKTSCALPSCHSAFARQGGLVLDSEDVSYVSLVGKPSVHPAAAQSGLLRVAPGDPANSFLIRKLRGLGPGDAMPQSGQELADPLIKMVESWIARGARTTAEECGGSGLCDDDPNAGANFVWKPEPPLEVPPAGQGIQLYTPPRDVAPGTEWETCYAFHPNWTELGAAASYAGGALPVIRQQTYRMHKGSHHLLLYAYFGPHPEGWAQGYFPCSAASCLDTNPDDCPSDASQFLLPIGGTQVAGTRYEVQYPNGVGIPTLGPNVVLIVNEHFTNPFQPPQPIYGEAWLNLYFYPPGDFKAVLDGIFAINYRDLFVEPFQSRTISSVWQPRSILTRAPADAAVFQLFGHMHKRGTLFQIDYVKGGHCSASGAACGRDGDCACKSWQDSCQTGQTCVRAPGAEDTTIYYTTHWDAAPVMDFQAPYLLLNREDGLRWTCTHVNGIEGDPAHPPKRCTETCKNSCGWDPATRTCHFDRGVQLGIDSAPRTYAEGDPMPLVFGELADDDMCNMFGYFINQGDLSKLH
jgi:hypothetical protein